MIRYLRQFQSSTFVALATFAVAVSMMLWGVERLFLARSNSTLAKGAHVISQAERQDVMLSLLARDHKNPSTLSEQELASYQKLADDVLLQELTIHNYTQNLGMFLHPDVLAFTLQKEGSMTGVQKALQEQRTHPDPHGLAQLQRRMQRFQRSMNQQILLNTLEDTSLSSPEDLNALAAVYQQKRAFAWFSIPLIPEKQAAYTPSDSSVKEYYDTHPFVQPAEMQVRYLQFPAQQFAPSTPPSDTTTKQYFAENPGRFDTPKQYHITSYSLMQDAQEDAKRLSTSAVLQNWITPDNKPKLSGKWLYYRTSSKRSIDESAIAQSPLATLKKGQYWLEQNEHGETLLSKCTEITPAKQCTLASCLPAVKKAWRDDLTRYSREQFIASLKDKLLFAPEDLSSLASSYNLTQQTTNTFTQSSGDDIASDPRFREAAFLDSMRTSSVVSDPVVLESGDVVVMQREVFTPASKQALATVKDTIIDNLRTENTLKSQRQAIDKALHDLKEGEKADVVAKRFASKIEKSSLRDQRHLDSLPTALGQAGFAAPADKPGWQNAQLIPDYAGQRWLVFALLEANYQDNHVDNDTRKKLTQLYHQLELSQALGNL